MKHTDSSKDYFFLMALAVAIIWIVAASTFAQDRAAEVDKIFSWIKPGEPGCSVAASQNGKLVFSRAYGLADLERGVPITSSTVFDAGSVRKQFVAAAIIILAQDGKLSLTDDIRKYIPELPDYGSKISIDNLLTHTSGIRDWQALLNLAGGDPTAFAMIMRQRGLNFMPGDEWSYSNSNYVLLPEIVARVSGMPFSEFARKRIFEPLGMKSTSHPEDPLFVIKDRALAYKKEKDRWKMDVYLGNDRGGAGGLFTTAIDLVTWNDALAANRLGAAVTQKLQEPAVLKNGRKLSYARGLQLEPFRKGGQLVWHSGGAAGYSAVEGRLTEHSVSVAIMCNADGTARSAYAGKIFDLLLPGSVTETPSVSNPAAVDAGEISSKAGTFFEEKTGEVLRLAVNNNTLTLAGGGPMQPVAAGRFRNLRPSTFFMSEASFELHFISPDRIELKTKEGEISHYRRAKSVTSEDLKELAGRYYSEELMATFDVSLTKDGLAVRANGANTVEFKPIEADVFQIGGSLLRFRRDKAGKISGLEYSNPLLRNIKFAQVARM